MSPAEAFDESIPHFHSIWNEQDQSKVQKKFEDILSQFSEGIVDSNSQVLRLEAMTQLARALGLQSKFDEANKTLAQVLEEFKATQVNLNKIQNATVVTRLELEQGRVFRSSKQVEASLPHFEAAFAQSKDIPELDYFAVDALHMVALVLPTEEEKEKTYQDAIERAHKSTNPRTKGWAASLLNNKAWDNMDAQKYDIAVRLFKEAMEIRSETYNLMTVNVEEGRKQSALRALRIGTYCYGHALRVAGNPKEALEVQEKLLASGHDGPFLREELALLYSEEKGDLNGAKEHAQNAFDLGFSKDNASAARVEKLEELIKA